MSAADAPAPAARRAHDPYRIGHSHPGHAHGAAAGHGEGGPADKRTIVAYGFWIFLLSDIVMFSAFFASYAVLAQQTAGGPGPRQLFDLDNVAIETGCLLISSFTCGMASLAAAARLKGKFYAAMAVTFLFGLAFVGLEAREFADMAMHGATAQRSAFLSAFFSLVGCHGLHVSCGLLWLLTMIAQVWAKGFRVEILRRIMCFSLFWHALDIIWVGLFTVVYLIGTLR